MQDHHSLMGRISQSGVAQLQLRQHFACMELELLGHPNAFAAVGKVLRMGCAQKK